MANCPSSLLSGDGVFSLAVDTRNFANFSRAAEGMAKQEKEVIVDFPDVTLEATITV